jgi:hypothetical protein
MVVPSWTAILDRRMMDATTLETGEKEYRQTQRAR